MAREHKGLTRYREVLSGHTRPHFKSAEMDEKVRLAMAELSACELCGHLCAIDRTKGDTGVCNVEQGLAVASAFDHYGEEPFFVPSFTVFFESCNFACQFCQNWDISQVDPPRHTNNVTAEELARAIDRQTHCKNVNFVGGEPTPYLPYILDTVSRMSINLPVVWNSNFYMSRKAMSLLSGVVDVYLSDFKYGNDSCAQRLSRVSDYSEIVRRNHKTAFEDAELVIRHLVMPGHVECCTIPILEFIAANFGDGVVINIMDQYRPAFRADRIESMNRRLTADEFRQATEQAEQLGLDFIT